MHEKGSKLCRRLPYHGRGQHPQLPHLLLCGALTPYVEDLLNPWGSIYTSGVFSSKTAYTYPLSFNSFRWKKAQWV